VIKDELESMGRYTKELEALKNYALVKEERDSLAKETAQLKNELVQLQAQLESEVSIRKELSSRLSNSEAEVRELSIRLDEARKELSSLRDFKAKLPEGSRRSLVEMRDQFLKSEEAEIERRAKARLAELEKGLRSQMPALVYKRLIDLIRRPTWPPEIEKVIDSRARKIADESLQDREKWPAWFKEHYLNEVKELVSKGLDSEFENRVQTEAERRLDAMKAGEWKEYAGSKARAIASSLKDLLKELQGTWSFTCERCGRRLALEVDPYDIGSLLRGETKEISCTTCVDPAPFPFLLSTVQHKVASLSLEGLLELYMGSAPP
jgi:chromosome segregation ATPase